MSEKRSLRLASLIVVVLLTFLSTKATAQLVTQNDEWVSTSSYGVPVTIALNYAPNARRTIYILIEPKYFARQNIGSLFNNLAGAYKEPDPLNISIFSDKGMLQRAIDSRFGPSIHWADTPSGRKAAKEWKKAYEPLPSGYYRAHYTRISHSYRIPFGDPVPWYTEEEYSYSPDPAKTDMVTVVVQGKAAGPPYTGKLATDLLMAAGEGDTSKLQLLIDQGADINSKDQDGDTPMMLAAGESTQQTLQIVNTLLGKGADVNARNRRGDTALIVAAGNYTPDILQALLAKGASVDVQNEFGESALFQAVVHSELANVKALLAKGANLDLATKDEGETPLTVAARYPNSAMVQTLLTFHANVHAKNRDGETALMRAAGAGNLESLRLLLKAGANPNDRNRDGETALMHAPNKATALLLLSSGAEIDARDDFGDTALMYAVSNDAVDVVKVLLARNADFAARNNADETAFSIASQDRKYDILDLLEARSAKRANGPRTIVLANEHPKLVIKRDPLAGRFDEVSVAFRPDGKILAADSSPFAGNHHIFFWDMSSGKLIKSIEGERDGEGGPPIRFIADGRSVASEFGSVWDVESGDLLHRVVKPGKAWSDKLPYLSVWSPDGKLNASAQKRIGERHRITVQGATNGQILRYWTTDADLQILEFSPDGKNLSGLMNVGADRIIINWDVNTGNEVQRLTVNRSITNLTFSRNRQTAAASGYNNEGVTVFDLNTGEIIHNLSRESSEAYSVAFSPGEKLLATGHSGYAAAVKLWDVAAGTLLRTLEGHSTVVRSVAFSPNGKFLASGGGKNEIRIWSVSTGELLLTFITFHDGNWIAYSPDGHYNRSKDAARYITWQVGADSYDEARYRSQFFKPDLIAERLH